MTNILLHLILLDRQFRKQGFTIKAVRAAATFNCSVYGWNSLVRRPGLGPSKGSQDRAERSGRERCKRKEEKHKDSQHKLVVFLFFFIFLFFRFS